MKPVFLYALHSGNLYGTERMALYTLEGLQGEFEPVLFAPTGPALEEAKRLGMTTVAFSGAKDFALKLRPYLHHQRIAFAATGVSHSLAFVLWNFFYRRKAVHLHLVHGGTDERESYGRKKLLNGLDVQFIAVSDFVRERLIANGTRASQIRVVGNFLPDERIRSAPRRNPFEQDGIRQVIVISRVDPIKRIDVLLDALEQHPELQDLPMRVYGTGWELEKFRARAAASLPNLIFAGFSDQVPNHLAESDLLLHLCPTEPFGLAILEAMAAGVPVLAPDQGGAAGLLEAGISGFHFAANDPGALASALSNLRQLSAEALNAVVAAAEQRLWAQYSASAGLNHYRKLLEGLNHD